jgi:hypothetical protein
MAPHDLWVMLFSLPDRLGVQREGLSGAPYLAAEPAGEGGIGLVEQGNPGNTHDLWRSIPQGLLQGAVPRGRLLQPTGDVAQSLRQLAGLDLLITVDTSWAHMAGALGVPCWLLLSPVKTDWRWLPKADYTPWYRSLRLFWQPAPGDWAAAIAEVKRALSSPSGGGGPRSGGGGFRP